VTVVVSAVVWISVSSWAEPKLDGALIFPVQTEHCHGSSIVELPNGDLLAAWFQGSGERSANDVRINGARLNAGATEWSPVFLMADTPNLPDCNPVLYLDSRDTLWLFWIRVVANRWEDSILMYRRTTDYSGDGAPDWAWQDVITLLPGEAFVETLEAKLREARVDRGMWGEYAVPYSRMLVEAARDKRKRQTGWMTRIHPIELASGRMMLPVYSDGFNISMTAISDDGGSIWRAGGPMVGAGPIQPTLAQRADGTIVAYCRDSGSAPGRVQRAESKDGGETWSITKDTEFPNPSSSLEVIVLNDGAWAMIYNDTVDGRHSLAVSMSDDEGNSWKWTRHLERSDRGVGSFAYPSFIQAADGSLHATYTYKDGPGGKAIKHSSFNTEWIKADD
jgi:predicted neuraminidase